MNAGEKLLAILEAVSDAEGPRRLAEIAESAGIGKPSAHRILQILVDAGFATSYGIGTYRVGPKLLALSSQVLAQDQRTRTTASVLESLAMEVRLTVHFAVRSGNEAVYVHKVGSDRPYEMASRVGMRIPLYCTAIGKSILASLPADELGEILVPDRLVARTENTLVRPDRLMEELKRVRTQGYAVDNEENEAHVRCVGAPVYDHEGRVIGGVSVSGLTFSLPLPEIEVMAPRVIETAKEITRIFATGNWSGSLDRGGEPGRRRHSRQDRESPVRRRVRQ